MEFRQFVKTVSDRASIDEAQAEKATRATLTTLAERLAGGEADDLAGQLPEELGRTMRLSEHAGHGHPLSADEFVATVAGREGVGDDEAREHTRAVFSTVRDAVTSGEFEDVLSQLPTDLRRLATA